MGVGKVTESNDAEGVEREREERATKTVAVRREPMTKGFYGEAASEDKSKVQLGDNSKAREKAGNMHAACSPSQYLWAIKSARLSDGRDTVLKTMDSRRWARRVWRAHADSLALTAVQVERGAETEQHRRR